MKGLVKEWLLNARSRKVRPWAGGGNREESKLKEGCRDGENRGAGREQGEGFALEVIASPRYCSSPSMLRGPGEISPCIPDLPNDTFSPSPWNIFIPSPLRLLFFWRGGEEEWKKCMRFSPFHPPPQLANLKTLSDRWPTGLYIALHSLA